MKPMHDVNTFDIESRPERSGITLTLARRERVSFNFNYVIVMIFDRLRSPVLAFSSGALRP